jgi:hypothetical protein
MTRFRLSPVGRMVLGVVIALLVISYVLRRTSAGGITPYLFLIASVLVVGVVVFALTRRVGGRR